MSLYCSFVNQRPNLLIFYPDGMQAEVVKHEHVCATPNVDRVAQRGLTFHRAYTVLPVCSPARASLMTGLLPHNHGVLQVEHCVDDDQSVLRTQHPHWAQRLSEAGYRTGYFGKWHIERTNRLEDFGWQVNGCDAVSAFRQAGLGEEGREELVNGKYLEHYRTGPDGYKRALHYGVTDVPTERRRFSHTTNMALDFLRDSLDAKSPWACCVSFSEPNAPMVAGHKVFERYDVDSIPLPESLKDDLAGRPAFYRRQREILADLTERQWRELRAVYYALVTELDLQLGRLLDAVERAGALERTIVVVMSDHGRYLGAHGFDNHNFGASEEIYRIPLIMAGPDIAHNASTDGLVTIADLCPTFLELAGAKAIRAPDSISFAPLLANPEREAKNFGSCYAEYHGSRFLMTQRVLWEGDWKFVFNGFDYDELYNLSEDPHELRNLAAESAHRERVRTMMSEIWRRVLATNDRTLAETHYSPMRFGAVGPKAAGGD